MNRLLLFLGLPALALASALVLQPATAADTPKLDPDQPYQPARKANPITYDVDFRVTVTPPYHSKVLKVWLPMPQSDPGQEVTEGELSSFPMAVKPRIGKETKYGNQFAYFEYDHPKGAQVIRHTFKIKVWELNWDIDPDKVARVKDWPVGFERFLKPEQQAVVINDEVRKVAQIFVPRSQGPAQDLTALMLGVNSIMKYDHDVASLHASSEHALKYKAGHCSDYHGLCAAVGRALGYPTRVTYGINPFPKNSPSHCKLEAYLPPYGWVSFDVSETQRVVADIQKDATLDAKKKADLTALANSRLARGFRDNTWFIQTRGTDYDLAPPAAKRAAVVRTIYAEADGVELADPDPANKDKREFTWMTSHQYTPDKPVSYPFKGWKSLEPK